jgi:hypothetical protein
MGKFHGTLPWSQPLASLQGHGPRKEDGGCTQPAQRPTGSTSRSAGASLMTSHPTRAFSRLSLRFAASRPWPVHRAPSHMPRRPCEGHRSQSSPRWSRSGFTGTRTTALSPCHPPQTPSPGSHVGPNSRVHSSQAVDHRPCCKSRTAQALGFVTGGPALRRAHQRTS